jgi:hypothetical protein
MLKTGPPLPCSQQKEGLGSPNACGARLRDMSNLPQFEMKILKGLRTVSKKKPKKFLRGAGARRTQGNQWMPTAAPHRGADPCMVYWNERGGFGRGGK